MLVSDVFPDLVRATQVLIPDVNFRYATDATTILSGKGSFDILMGYLTMPIPQGTNLLTMPPQVYAVLKVNIDGNPSFTRDRLYEFSMNSPGSDAERVGFTWEQRGTVPTQVALPLNETTASAAVYPKGEAAEDNGKFITITGEISTGEERTETVTIQNFFVSVTTNLFTKITRILKDVTVGNVSLYSKWVTGAPGTGDALLSVYSPGEIEPQYRQIRISKTDSTAYIFYRRSIFKITSLRDFIPVQSKRALLLMIKAIKKYETNDQTASADEDKAVAWAKEEQGVIQASIELAQSTESPGIRGLNLNNRDSLIAADVYDEASRIFGPIGEQKLYDKITEGLELLNNKGHWEGLVGYVDIMTDQFHYVTLPRYIEDILAMQVCGSSTEIRSSWYEFHMDGFRGCSPCRGQTREAGDTVTFRDVNYPQKLVAIPDLSSDIGLEMRAFGYYQGKRIMTPDANGTMQDGFPIDVNMSGGISSNQFVDRIERITKAKSNGFVKLLGFDATRNVQVIIGYYWPDETEPRYRRIYVPGQYKRLRIKYRKNTMKISSLTDPLHLKSKTAVTSAFRAIKLMDDGKFQEALIPEETALRLLEEEQRSSHPNDEPELEISGNEFANNFYVN